MCRTNSEELRACQADLAAMAARCSRQACERNNNDKRFNDMLQQNARHRQANVALQAERDALREQLAAKSDELRALVSDHEAASLVLSEVIGSLESDVKAREQTIADRARQITSLESDVDERDRQIDSINDRLDQLE